MVAQNVYALILDTEIKNIIVCADYSTANYLAKATYGETASAEDCLYYACGIGDIYEDGMFYKVDEEGVKTLITKSSTESEEIENINETINNLLGV